MAELKYHWKFDEGSGSTLQEELNDNDAIISYTATSPDWVTGYEGDALEFEYTGVMSGNYIDLSATPYAHASDTMGCGVADDFSMLARFKRNTSHLGSSGCRVFFSMSAFDEVSDPYFYAGFYTGCDDKIHFGCLLNQGGNRLPLSAYTDAAITDDDWHTVLGRYKYDLSTGTTMEIWLDEVKQSSVATSTYGINGSFWSAATPLIGMSRLNNYGTFTLFPQSYIILGGFPEEKSIGSFGGTVDDCRIWCGAPTDSEIEDIFNGKKPFNSILFGCNT
jgi:hypothetical protein